jgi:hypothetical protein
MDMLSATISVIMAVGAPSLLVLLPLPPIWHKLIREERNAAPVVSEEEHEDDEEVEEDMVDMKLLSPATSLSL